MQQNSKSAYLCSMSESKTLCERYDDLRAQLARINICEYKLHWANKYLNTSTVTSDFNMVLIPQRPRSAQRASHSPNHVSRSRWILYQPNGTFDLTDWLGMAPTKCHHSVLIANPINAPCCTSMHSNWLSFIHSGNWRFQPKATREGNKSSAKCHDICQAHSA